MEQQIAIVAFVVIFTLLPFGIVMALTNPFKK